MILKLHVNTRTKASLIVALSLGIFAELHAGILAASLPTLRPLFKSLLETTSRHMRSHGYYTYGSSRYGTNNNRKSGSNSTGGRTKSGGTPRSAGYYRRQTNPAAAAADDDDDYEMMESLGGRRNKSSETDFGVELGYNARITSRNPATALGGGGGAASSEECILPPPPNAITKRTEVVIQKSGGVAYT
ncbi:hypothetical protein PG984_015546 [Apiospora sp. TS-2023a]